MLVACPAGDFADVVKAAGKKDLNIRESIAYKAFSSYKTMSRYEEEFTKREPAERLEARIHHVLPTGRCLFCVPEIKRRQCCNRNPPREKRSAIV